MSEEVSDDERSEELRAIKAIFPELKVNADNPFFASLDLLVIPSKPISISVPRAVGNLPGQLQNGQAKPAGGSDHAIPEAQAAPEIKQLSYLPPLTIDLKLPGGYPSDLPPEFRLSSLWIPSEKLEDLEAHLRSLWEENGRNAVVYDFIDYLQQLSEKAFDVDMSRDGVSQEGQHLEIVLLDYDLMMQKAKFDEETFECGICLEPKKGKACHRLNLCGHVFCVECLKDFYNTCITEGDIQNVKCQAPKCEETAARRSVPTKKKRRPKQDGTLEPSELLEISLEQEQVQRYIRLKRQKALEADKSTIYCPRKWCQEAAQLAHKRSSEDEEADEDHASNAEVEDTAPAPDDQPGEKFPPPAERLAICTSCAFAFCIVCETSWHGEFAPCHARSQAEVSAEEAASQEYLLLHSSPCPTCAAPCQKTGGCNHIVCFTCQSHFCYLCSSYLQIDNPYKHFNTEWEPCYMRLWDGEGGDVAPIPRRPPPRNRARAPRPPPVEQRPVTEAVREVGAAAGVDGGDEGEEGRAEGPLPPAPDPPRAPQPPWRMPGGLARIRPPAPVGEDAGLQRFLRLAMDDQEDEWDSDEMDDDEEIPVR